MNVGQIIRRNFERPRKQRSPLLCVVSVLILAGCATIRPGLDHGAVLGYEGLGRDVERFYNARAWEENATTPNPRLDRLLGASVIAETEEQVVASIRYSWRSGGGEDFERRGRSERRFTFEKVDADTVRIAAMTGEQRARPR